MEKYVGRKGMFYYFRVFILEGLVDFWFQCLNWFFFMVDNGKNYYFVQRFFKMIKLSK